MIKSLNWLLTLFSKSVTPHITNLYRIISINDCYHDTGNVQVKVQIVNTGKTFDKPISELYQQEWLNQFSREDVAHIAALYTAEHTKNLALIKLFPKQSPAIKESAYIVGVLFTACLILSNLTATKLSSFGPLIFPAGLIFFPVTYVFDDILTEVYGFKVSRRIIWSALLANLIVFTGTLLTTYLPSATTWHDQEAYANIYRATPRIFLASMIGYLCGEFTNSIILAKLKILTAGRHLWLRIITSTATGVGIDTVCFMHLAFLFVVPYAEIWQIILTMYVVKVCYETFAMPITYKVANYLKRKDNVDHYDFQTNFNPFSLAI